MQVFLTKRLSRLVKWIPGLPIKKCLVSAVLGSIIGTFSVVSLSDAATTAGITGTVINFLTGEPVSGLRLTAQTNTNIVEEAQRAVLYTNTDKNGAFTFKNGLSGYYYSVATPSFHWSMAGACCYQTVFTFPAQGGTAYVGNIYVLQPPPNYGAYLYVRKKRGFLTLPRKQAEVLDSGRIGRKGKAVVNDLKGIPAISLEDTIVIHGPANPDGRDWRWYISPLAKDSNDAWYFPNDAWADSRSIDFVPYVYNQGRGLSHLYWTPTNVYAVHANAVVAAAEYFVVYANKDEIEGFPGSSMDVYVFKKDRF